MANRSTNAAVCRSTPDKINNIVSNIDDCTTSLELTRKSEFGKKILLFGEDIVWLKSNITNSLATGEALFSPGGQINIINEVKTRKKELLAKKKELEKKINKDEQILQRSDRDFLDVKNGIPEKQEIKSLYVLEDYTLSFLFISYVFMILIFIYSYTVTSSVPLTGLYQSIVISIIVSMITFLLFYYMV